VHKFNKGDLVLAWLRRWTRSCKGLVIGHRHDGRPKVLWFTGPWEGETTYHSPADLTKMEVESA
jgi:hypothetical protein